MLEEFENFTSGGRKIKIPTPGAHIAEFMDVSMILWRISQDHSQANLAAGAWGHLESWVRAAELQIARVQHDHAIMQQRMDLLRTTKLLPGSPGTDWGEASWWAEVDVHFYFVCWDNARLMWDVVRTKARVDGLGDLNRRYGRLLEDYSDARDILEHLNERLPGMAKATDLQLPEQPNVWVKGAWGLDGSYGIGGRRWDVSPASTQPLRDLLEAAEAAIRAEGRVVMDRQLERQNARHRAAWERDATCAACGALIDRWEAAYSVPQEQPENDRVIHFHCVERFAKEAEAKRSSA